MEQEEILIVELLGIEYKNVLCSHVGNGCNRKLIMTTTVDNPASNSIYTVINHGTEICRTTLLHIALSVYNKLSAQ